MLWCWIVALEKLPGSCSHRLPIDCNNVSLLPGFGPTKRQERVLAGPSFVNELAEAQGSALTRIKGIGSKSARSLTTAG